MAGDVKTTYVKTHGDMDRFCASREGDAVATTENGISLGFGNTVTGDKVGESMGSGALSLGGRDPSVLMARELMYRVCELSMNLNLDKNETIEMYKLFLKTIVNISKNDKSSGVAGLSADAKAPILNQNTKVVNSDDDDDD